MGAAPDQSVTTATGTAWHCDCHSATGTAPGTASGSATHPYHDHVITHWHWQWYCTACTLPWLLRLHCSLQTYYTTLLYLDSPFTVVDAFLLSYRYLPFLVDFFTYSLTLYDGAILFSDDYWIEWGYWLWSEKIKKHLHKIPPRCLLIFPRVHIVCHPGTLAQPTHWKRWWGLSPGWVARGSTFSTPIPLAY